MLVLSLRDCEGIVVRVPGRKQPIRFVLVTGRAGQAQVGVVAEREIDVNRDKVDRDIQRNGSRRRRLLAG